MQRDGNQEDTTGADTGPPISSDRIGKAKDRVDLYGFLAKLLNTPPNLELVRGLRQTDFVSMAASKKEVGATDIARALEEVSGYFMNAAEKPEKEVQQDLAVDWTRLFRGVSPNYGPPPPYEAVYHQTHLALPELLMKILSSYHEGGVTVEKDAANRPDYIGVEFEYLQFLGEHEIEDLKQGDREEANRYRECAAHFLEDHLGQWAGLFCDKAIPMARTDFFLGILHLIKAVA
jgi:TorA maturation chaperone TorD